MAAKIDDLLSEMEMLRNIRADIRERVAVAKSRSEMPTRLVEKWLSDVDSFVADADTFISNYGRKALWRRYMLRHEAKEKRLQVRELLSVARNFADVSSRTAPFIVRTPSITTVVGMEQNFEELRQCLNEKDVGIIGINGMGGAGKTTLLTSIYNETSVRKIFDLTIFVIVSEHVDVRRLQGQILDSLGFPPQQSENQELQAAQIYRYLTDRRYMLALDDIWKPLDLETIGIPHPNSINGCKILFTTRSEDVCLKMKAQRTIRVKPLSMEASWDLFGRYVGDAIISQPEIMAIAKKMAIECSGLPLALVTVGRTAASLRTEREWHHALQTLKEQELGDKLFALDAFKGPESGDKLFVAFEFSYESLSTQLLKDCFLYCSLFPEDYAIKNEELIRYWIGEGFFDHMKELESIYEGHKKGLDLIQQLKAISMLQEGNDPHTEVIMHDFVRNLALSKMKNKFLVEAGSKLTTAPPVERWEEAERVSLMYNNIKSLDEVPSCPRLQTLILRKNIYLKKISNNILQSHALRVLDLSNTGIRDIPSSIGSLVELGYLDLSFTKITSLPKEVGQLVKLKHLGLEGTSSLAEVPGDVISRFSNVLVLNMYDSYGDWEVKGCHGEESMARMEELECLKRLKDIGLTICNTPAFNRFLSSPALTRSTRKLILKDCQDLPPLHLSFIFKSMQELTVSDCFHLKEFIIGGYGVEGEEGVDTQLSSLNVLQLIGLYEVQISWGGLVPGNCLWMLRELTIGFCHELTNITWVSQLKCLEHMTLYSCKKIENVIKGDINDGAHERLEAFHKLRTITLRKLPSLNRIIGCTLEFPCLESLNVLECPQLRNLPLGTQSAKKSIRVILGEKEWWEDLEWEDGRARFVFHRYFQAE